MTLTARQPHPGRALAHPLWIGALTLLVLNDHVLKGGDLVPPFRSSDDGLPPVFAIAFI